MSHLSTAYDNTLIRNAVTSMNLEELREVVYSSPRMTDAFDRYMSDVMLTVDWHEGSLFVNLVNKKWDDLKTFRIENNSYWLTQFVDNLRVDQISNHNLRFLENISTNRRITELNLVHLREESWTYSLTWKLSLIARRVEVNIPMLLAVHAQNPELVKSMSRAPLLSLVDFHVHDLGPNWQQNELLKNVLKLPILNKPRLTFKIQSTIGDCVAAFKDTPLIFHNTTSICFNATLMSLEGDFVDLIDALLLVAPNLQKLKFSMLCIFYVDRKAPTDEWWANHNNYRVKQMQLIQERKYALDACIIMNCQKQYL